MSKTIILLLFDCASACRKNTLEIGKNGHVFGKNMLEIGNNMLVFGKNELEIGKNTRVFGNNRHEIGKNTLLYGKNRRVFGKIKSESGKMEMLLTNIEGWAYLKPEYMQMESEDIYLYPVNEEQ
jgi:hypothetical protein